VTSSWFLIPQLLQRCTVQ